MHVIVVNRVHLYCFKHCNIGKRVRKSGEIWRKRKMQSFPHHAIPHHRPLGLLFHIAQFEMQLQGTMPIECQHITKQHGGTAFTKEITHYAAVSHKNIFQLHFHCICWCEFAWKWISTAAGNRALTDGKKDEGEKCTDGGQASFLMPTYKMWPAQRSTLWWEMRENKWSIHLQKGLEDDKERWMDEMEGKDRVEEAGRESGGLNDEVCSVWQAAVLLFPVLHGSRASLWTGSAPDLQGFRKDHWIISFVHLSKLVEPICTFKNFKTFKV